MFFNEGFIDFGSADSGMKRKLLPRNSHLESRGINLQATGCDLGGNLDPIVVTWYSTPPSRLIPSEANGGGPYEKNLRSLF